MEENSNPSSRSTSLQLFPEFDSMFDELKKCDHLKREIHCLGNGKETINRIYQDLNDSVGVIKDLN